MKRRSFIRNSASAAILTTVAGCQSYSSGQKESDGTNHLNSNGPFLHLGRTENYQPFSVIEKGLKIAKIETYSKQNIALVKITLDTGAYGWGQIYTYNSDIACPILHRNLAHLVLGQDPASIDELVDQCIERNLK